MNKILSIIIPAYNVEDVLKRCVDSCKSQDLHLSTYEIIVINDGSTDNTLKVARIIEQESENVIVISQENKGLSGARNTGLNNAVGKYVWFVDSDDYLERNVLQSLINEAEIANLDCLFFRLRRIFENDGLKKEVGSYECMQPSVQKNRILDGYSAIIQGYNPSSVCSALLKREFLTQNKLEFMLGIYHEDAEFTYRMISKAQRVKFVEESPYLYYTHTGTMTRSKSISSLTKNRVDDVVVAKSYISLSKELEEERAVSRVVLKRAKSILFGLLWELWNHKKEWNENGITAAVLDKMISENLYPVRPPYGNFLQAIVLRLILNKKRALMTL